MKNSPELQPSRPPQPPESSFFVSIVTIIRIKMLSGYLGVGVHQLDVVVEHVEGGFHLTRSGISNLNL